MRPFDHSSKARCTFRLIIISLTPSVISSLATSMHKVLRSPKYEPLTFRTPTKIVKTILSVGAKWPTH